VRLYLRWDLSNFVYLLFFPEFVCGLSHVGLYLEWDLSDFFFLNLCVGCCFLNFFLIVLVLLNWGLIKLKHF
jgi:hypothetical protein